MTQSPQVYNNPDLVFQDRLFAFNKKYQGPRVIDDLLLVRWK